MYFLSTVRNYIKIGQTSHETIQGFNAVASSLFSLSANLYYRGNENFY